MTTTFLRKSFTGLNTPAAMSCKEHVGSGRRVEWLGSQAPTAYRLSSRHAGPDTIQPIA